MACRDGAIDDKHVAVIDTFFHHAVTTGFHIEGGRRVGDAVLVEVDGLFHIVLSRGGESAGGRAEVRGISMRGASIAWGIMAIFTV